MNFKEFYVRYRKPIFVATTILSSVIIAFAVDKYVLRNKTKIKVKKNEQKNE